MCGQQDLNLHGCPLEPKSSASANSAMTAWFVKKNAPEIDHFGACVLEYCSVGTSRPYTKT